MNNMRNKIVMAAAFGLMIGFSANAQVGIGNSTPDSTSILDLTNSNSRGFVLPSANTTAGFSNRVNGMMYYFQDNIYYKTSFGYNAITPWKFKFNGAGSNDIYYDLGGKINIGATSLTTPPEAPLQIETVQPISLNGDNGSFQIGSVNGANTAFNNTGFQARNTGSAAPLSINENGGDVNFGSTTSAVKVNVNVSGKVKELNTNTNTYYDLLPAGTVVMWYGNVADVPNGWAFCDGSSQPKSDGSGTIKTPDLRSRFVVSVWQDGVVANNPHQSNSLYTPNSIGGANSVPNSMPTHSHTFSASGSTSTTGSHSHKYRGYYNDSDTDGNDGAKPQKSRTRFGSDPLDYGGEPAGSHSHSVNVSGQTNATGTNNSNENRPAFYALVYMMKL